MCSTRNTARRCTAPSRFGSGRARRSPRDANACCVENRDATTCAPRADRPPLAVTIVRPARTKCTSVTVASHDLPPRVVMRMRAPTAASPATLAPQLRSGSMSGNASAGSAGFAAAAAFAARPASQVRPSTAMDSATLNAAGGATSFFVRRLDARRGAYARDVALSTGSPASAFAVRSASASDTNSSAVRAVIVPPRHSCG